MPRHAARVAAVLAGAIPGAIGQSDAATALRGPALGEIRTRDGAPWAGAEVVLLSRPLPTNPNCGEPDRVTARTDERGRFRAEILRGRPYSAWAWGEPTAAGRPATTVAESVFVQVPVLLREERVLPGRSVALAKTERWPAAQLRLRIVDHTGNRDVHWLGAAGGAAVLPFLVGAEATIEAFACYGERLVPLALVTVPATAPGGTLQLELPERRSTTCTVRSSDRQEPCAGAVVYQRLGGALHRQGVTDAGEVRLDLAVVESSYQDFALLASAPDQQLGVLLEDHGLPPRVATNLAAEHPLVRERKRSRSDPRLLATVRAGRTVHVRVIGRSGPLAGVEAWCGGHASNRSQDSELAVTVIRSLRADAHGRLTIDGLAARDRGNLHLLLREQDLAALPAAWRAGLGPVVFAPLLGAAGTGTAADPFVVDLQRMAPVELQFTCAGGAPAAGVEVCFGGVADWRESPWTWEHQDLLADQRGTVRALLPAGRRLGFRAVGAGAMLLRAIEAAPARADAGPALARFTLPQPCTLRGRLLTAAGAPVRGHFLQALCEDLAGWSYDPAEGVALVEEAARNRVHVVLPQEQREWDGLAALVAHPARCDDGGRFTLALPAAALPDLTLVVRTPGTQTWALTRRLAWNGGSVDDFDLTLR